MRTSVLRCVVTANINAGVAPEDARFSFEIEGIARFLDPHTVEVTTGEGTTTVRGDYVLIACGTRPARSRSIPLDGKRMVDTDQRVPPVAERGDAGVTEAVSDGRPS
jgi:hypothetical protein